MCARRPFSPRLEWNVLPRGRVGSALCKCCIWLRFSTIVGVFFTVGRAAQCFRGYSKFCIQNSFPFLNICTSTQSLIHFPESKCEFVDPLSFYSCLNIVAVCRSTFALNRAASQYSPDYCYIIAGRRRRYREYSVCSFGEIFIARRTWIIDCRGSFLWKIKYRKRTYVLTPYYLIPKAQAPYCTAKINHSMHKQSVPFNRNCRYIHRYISQSTAFEINRSSNDWRHVLVIMYPVL